MSPVTLILTWFKPGLQSGVNFPALERYCRDRMTSLHPTANLPDSDRQNMAVQTLAGGVPVSQLALQHGVSRKFVYQQKNMASAALDEVFASSEPDDEVLFELPVTKTWLRQLTLGLS